MFFFHVISLHFIAKTASPGPVVPVPTLGLWKFQGGGGVAAAVIVIIISISIIMFFLLFLSFFLLGGRPEPEFP